MKSQGIVKILFLLCFFYTVPFLYAYDFYIYENEFEGYDIIQSIKENEWKQDKSLIELLEKQKGTKGNLSKSELKKLLLSYAAIRNADKATEYASEYIKKYYDVQILNSDEFDSISKNEAYLNLRKTYLPRINGWILFFIITGIVGVFVSIVMNLRRRGDMLSNLLMGLFVFFHSLFLLHLSLYLTNYNYYFPHSYWGTITFSFLYGPLLYFYFKRTSERYVLKRKDFLHLIPTFLIVLYFIPTYFLSGNEKLHQMFNVDAEFALILRTIIAIKAISLIIYGILTLKIYDRNKNNTTKFPSVILWQRNMSLLNMGYAITYLIYGVILSAAVIFDRSNNVMLYSQVTVLSCIVLYVAYTAYVQPDIFHKKFFFDTLVSKYQKSGLTDSYSHELKNQLLNLLDEEKVFKVNDLSLNSLAEIVGTSRHNLSQVINEHFNMNFFNLINKYRIEEAQEILLKDCNRNLNIIDVAYDVGFNNKVTFNKAFKEITNHTPSQFIKLQKRTSYQVKLR